MALVVLLRGVNVGGHRTFRPSMLAKELGRFDIVNVGAAGTFVVRKTVSRTQLRAAMMRRLPFDTHLMICNGGDVLRIASRDPFAGQPAGPGIVRFVSVLAKRVPLRRVPLDLPPSGEWGLRVLAYQDRFVFGMYRRQMKAIRYLGRLDRLGVPLTTRNWNTILSCWTSRSSLSG